MTEKHRKILELWEKHCEEWEGLPPEGEPLHLEPELREGLSEILTDFAQILKQAEKNPKWMRRLQHIWQSREAVAKPSPDRPRSQPDGPSQT